MWLVDSQWFTAYAVLELEFSAPILDALGLYCGYIQRQADYRCSKIHRVIAEVADPEDPGIRVVLIARCPWLLEEVPIDERTPSLCEFTVKNCTRALQWVPEQTAELCKTAVITSDEALEWVQPQFRTHELLHAMVTRHPQSIRHLSYEEQEQYPDLCLSAVSQDGLLLEHVEEDLRTRELCIVAVKENPAAMHYVTDGDDAIQMACVIGYLSKLRAKMQIPECADTFFGSPDTAVLCQELAIVSQQFLALTP